MLGIKLVNTLYMNDNCPAISLHVQTSNEPNIVIILFQQSNKTII